MKKIIAIALTAGLTVISARVKAEQKAECFMINPSGEYIDLSAICYVKIPQTPANNNSANSRENPVAAEETNSKNNLSFYGVETVPKNLNSASVRSDLQSNFVFRQLLNSVPVSNNYYNPTRGNYRQRKLFKRIKQGRNVNQDLLESVFESLKNPQ